MKDAGRVNGVAGESGSMWILQGRLVRVASVGEGRGPDVPLDVFRVGAKVGCMVDFVLEELYNPVSEIEATKRVDKGSLVGVQYQ